MTNPARELAELLEQWKVIQPSTTVYTGRGDPDHGVDFWRQQVHASRLVAAVDDAITALAGAGRKVDHYERALELWYSGIIGPDHQWSSATGSTREFIPQSAIDQLFALADVLDTWSSFGSVTLPQVTETRTAIDEIEALLNGDDIDLTPAYDQYLRRLLAEARSVLTDSLSGSTLDLASRVHELYGALLVIAETIETDQPEASSKLRGIATRIVPWMRTAGNVTQKAVEFAANINELSS